MLLLVSRDAARQAAIQFVCEYHGPGCYGVLCCLMMIVSLLICPGITLQALL
jgi:hypothetical protein